MVRSCCVIDCTARKNPGEEGFFKIPSEREPERRKAWLDLICRSDFDDNKKRWTPSVDDRVCSAHFLNGSPHPDPLHPDYKPHYKMGYPASMDLGKKQKALDRYLRTSKRFEAKLTTVSCAETSTNSPVLLATPAEQTPPQQIQQNEDVEMEPSDRQQSDLPGCVRCHELEKENIMLKKALEEKEKVVFHFNLECVKIAEERERLQQKLDKTKMSVVNLTESQLKYFTGVRCRALFLWIVSLVAARRFPTLCKKLALADKILLIFMKLRLGLQYTDLAFRFGIQIDQASKLFTQGVPVLVNALRFLVVWPEKGAIIRNVPKAFKRGKSYRNTRVIIDCSEVFIQCPSNLLARNITYSSYKHHNTIKFLVGITPTGAVSFLSHCWGGRVSDKELTINSGFLNLLEHGDQVMADRGFLIKEELLCRGASLVIPYFSKGKNQLRRTEVITSRKIANVRIHDERAIGRMKKFQILNTTWPLDLVKNANDIIYSDHSSTCEFASTTGSLTTCHNLLFFYI